MKGTDHFKRTIYMYLEQRAEEDALFAKKYRNPAKNMDECVTHILNYVQKSGCNGFTDGEIFGQAIHYYEENEIEVGKPKSYQSCFATFTRKEDVRSPLYGARYHSSLPLLLTGSCPSRARKSASGILLTASISVLSMPVSVDDELDTDPELRVELPCVATPKATLPQVGKQGDTVCHVTLHIERQRTAVDEGVPVVQRGAVMQHLLPPIYRLISGESRSPGIDENNLSGVRQYLEVIAALRRELRHGYLGVLVGIVLQQVFATEHPLVPLLRVGGESRPEAVPAVLAAEIEAVRHVRPHLDALHLRQTPLGVRLPCKKGKRRDDYCDVLSHGQRT